MLRDARSSLVLNELDLVAWLEPRRSRTALGMSDLRLARTLSPGMTSARRLVETSPRARPDPRLLHATTYNGGAPSGRGQAIYFVWWRRGRVELPVQRGARLRSYRRFRRFVLDRWAVAGPASPDRADES